MKIEIKVDRWKKKAGQGSGYRHGLRHYPGQGLGSVPPLTMAGLQATYLTTLCLNVSPVKWEQQYLPHWVAVRTRASSI